MPSDFKIVNTDSAHALKDNGNKAKEGSTVQKAYRTDLTDLILAMNGGFNYFYLGYSDTNSVTAENWEKVDDSVRHYILETAQKQIPILADTSSSFVVIDGVQFKKTESIFKKTNSSLRYSYLATFYKGYYFVIIYMYMDSVAGSEIINMLNASKFDK